MIFYLFLYENKEQKNKWTLPSVYVTTLFISIETYIGGWKTQ